MARPRLLALLCLLRLTRLVCFPTTAFAMFASGLIKVFDVELAISERERMRVPFSSYIICATPRSGSTLLCDLLTASGAAGRPNSYLRSQDIEYWTRLWGVERPTTMSDSEFNSTYLAAMKGAGSADTGIFGLRLMWDTVSDIERRLILAFGETADFAALVQRALGTTLFIHLSRRDKDAQAVSLVRAEQTGLWHVAADGSERERTAPPKAPSFNAARIGSARERLLFGDANWSSFFDQCAIKPLKIIYEDLAKDPQSTLAQILSMLGRDTRIASMIRPATAKMADRTSLAWEQQMKVLKTQRL